jgi:hypothetical protein
VRLKQRVAEFALLDPALLPHNDILLDNLRGQAGASRGRRQPTRWWRMPSPIVAVCAMKSFAQTECAI